MQFCGTSSPFLAPVAKSLGLFQLKMFSRFAAFFSVLGVFTKMLFSILFSQSVKRADQNKASVRCTKFQTLPENWLFRDRNNRSNSVTPQPRFQKKYSCVCRVSLGRAAESAQSNTFLQARGLVLMKENTSNVMTLNPVPTRHTCGRYYTVFIVREGVHIDK